VGDGLVGDGSVGGAMGRDLVGGGSVGGDSMGGDSVGSGPVGGGSVSGGSAGGASAGEGGSACARAIGAASTKSTTATLRIGDLGSLLPMVRRASSEAIAMQRATVLPDRVMRITPDCVAL